MPKASDSPAIQAASSSSVAPRKFRPAARPLPTAVPTTPPALWRSDARLPVQASSAPQLATSTSTKPAMRTAVLARELALASGCAADMPPAGQPQHASGNRKAGRPNRKNSRSASQAPMRPDAVVDRRRTAGGGKARVVGDRSCSSATSSTSATTPRRWPRSRAGRGPRPPRSAAAIARRRGGFSQPGNDLHRKIGRRAHYRAWRTMRAAGCCKSIEKLYMSDHPAQPL